MATWGIGPYANDFAQDWAEDLQESNDLYFIENTLDNVLSGEGADVLEAPYGAEGLAAVEALLRLFGRDGASDEDTQAVDDWVGAIKGRFRPRADLFEKAGRALDLILSERSELRELWHDSEHYEPWRAGVLAQKARLQG